jgi:hypothetical protein
MTKLERRCRMLMCAYPAAYRQERAEEMLGTLLDTTPEGRTWPLPRDVGALLAGGLRARTASKRRLTLGTNLRTSVCAGVAAYLGFTALRQLGSVARVAATAGGWAWEVRFYGWPYLVAFALMALAVVLAVADGRRALVLAGALPAAGLMCYAAGAPLLDNIVRVATPVTCLAILVALSSRTAPLAQRSLWPVGLVVLSSLLLGFVWNPVLFLVLLLAVGAVSLARIPLDARPAIAACVFVLLCWLPAATLMASSAGAWLVFIPAEITLAIAALAAWRLRSQSVKRRQAPDMTGGRRGKTRPA